MVELDPATQGTLITLINVMASTVIFKLKQYKDRESRAGRRADAIAAAVDDALAGDGKITQEEMRRIIAVANKAAG